jgi:hypothetical protein
MPNNDPPEVFGLHGLADVKSVVIKPMKSFKRFSIFNQKKVQSAE